MVSRSLVVVAVFLATELPFGERRTTKQPATGHTDIACLNVALPFDWPSCRVRTSVDRFRPVAVSDQPRALSKRLLPLNTPSLLCLDPGRWHTCQTVVYRGTGVTRTAVLGQPCGHPRDWIPLSISPFVVRNTYRFGFPCQY